VRRRRLTVRTIALLGAASAAVHQLRYAIGFGDGASSALAAHPHGYLNAAMPGVAAMLIIAFAMLLMRAAGGARRDEGRNRGLVSLWIACAAALALIYGLQETIEGSGALLNGGWIGLALSVPAGLLVALALRGADAAEAPAQLNLLVVESVGTAVARVVDRPPATAAVRRPAARGPPPAFVV